MSALKVLHVLAYGGMGGIGRHVQTQMRSLRDRSIEAVLCVLTRSGIVSEAIGNDGFSVAVLGAGSGHTPSLVPRFFQVVRRFRPDVVHFHGPHLLPGLVMRLFPDVPVVCSQHLAFRGGIADWRMIAAWRVARGRVDVVTPVSRWTARELARAAGIDPERIQVFYNCVDVATLAERGARARARRPGASHRIVGGIGRLVEAKGWEDFLESARLLIETRGDVRFVVLGDGPMRESLKQKAVSLGISDHVEWLGFVDDAVERLACFDVFLFTSLHEELPTTLLEAFAVRTPVAGFIPVGGTAEILEFSPDPVALLSSERSASVVARAVSDLLDSRARAQALVDNAWQVVHDHFDVQGRAGEVVEVYQELASRRASEARFGRRRKSKVGHS